MSAFTLVNLLMAIGGLAALLLPAVQVTERIQCTNHLKQLWLGVHNFISIYNESLSPLDLKIKRPTIVLVLSPFIEQQGVWNFITSFALQVGGQTEHQTNLLGTKKCSGQRCKNLRYSPEKIVKIFEKKHVADILSDSFLTSHCVFQMIM